jgi:uncharacterized protein YraI
MTEAECKRAGRNSWCKVRYQGIAGWVAGRYLMEDNNPPTKPEDSARPIAGSK